MARRAQSGEGELKLDVEGLLTHACAAIALAFGYRSAQFAASWIDVPPQTMEPGELPLLSIIVPARNEANWIVHCLHTLLAQRWVRFEVVAVDDESTDETLEILEILAENDGRLRVIRGEPLPEGWVGKAWALHQGATAAGGTWFLFTDADSMHVHNAAASALFFALSARLDALSLVTYQILGSFWERAAVPPILGSILFAGGPLGEINDPGKPERALANGQFLLISRTAYESLGGHAAIRDEIVEDVEFARRIKADGRFRFALAGGTKLAGVRMYRSFAEIWRGFSKNVYAGARGNAPMLAAGFAFLLATSIVPPVLAARALRRRRYRRALEALACTGATVASFSWSLRLIGLRPGLAVLHPLGSALFAAITLNSIGRVLSGRGVEWRGRRYTGRGGSTAGGFATAD